MIYAFALPMLIVLLLNVVYLRAFKRGTGLGLRARSIGIYFFAGTFLTVIIYGLLLALNSILTLNFWNIFINLIISPVIEDTLKYFLLSFLLVRVQLSVDTIREDSDTADGLDGHRRRAENLQETAFFRQSVLAGIVFGLAFGLVETYLYSLGRGAEANTLLLGSIPLQMIIGGSMSAIIAKRTKHTANLSGKTNGRPNKWLLLIIGGHILYNQSLYLPFANLVLIPLFVASIVFLHLLARKGESRVP